METLAVRRLWFSAQGAPWPSSSRLTLDADGSWLLSVVLRGVWPIFDAGGDEVIRMELCDGRTFIGIGLLRYADRGVLEVHGNSPLREVAT